MAITVNGVEITDEMIENELPRHADADNPLKRAVHEVVLRQLLLQQAAKLGFAHPDDNDDARIDRVIAAEVHAPEATETECETWYTANPTAFTVGELMEASHILFQVTEGVSLDALRGQAMSVLADVRTDPSRFAELARANSNCPSSEVGGSLGQLSRGQTVPEFEQALFSLASGETCERLVETRFGLHIIRADRREAGRLLPFAEIKDALAEHLNQQSHARALHQYLKQLVGGADVQGVELEGSDSPLVQ